MANIRYLSVVTEEKLLTQYLVSIQDTEFSDSAALCTMRNVSITTEGQGESRIKPISGASANAELVIDTPELETLLEDIAGAPEGRFTIVIGIVTTFPAADVKFVGYILTDLISIPDKSYKENYSIQLRATDGISRLKKIDYNDDGDPYEGYNTIVGHIFNCLNKLPAITGAYGSSDDFLKIVFNWYEENRTYSASENMLTLTRCNHVAFYTIDSKGNYNYKSCYDVLEEICKTFFCRMYFSNGTFWVESLDELRLSGLNARNVFIYDKNQSESTDTVDFRILNDNTDLDNTDLIRLEGGEYTFFPPLKKVAVRYAHRSTINMLAGKTISDTGGGPMTYETVDYYNGDGKLYLTGTRRWIITALNGDVPPFYFVWNLTIQVGSNYYVTNDAGGSPQWSATPGFYKIITNESSVGIERILSIPPILTLPLLGSGDLTFNVSFSAFFAIDNTPASGVDVEWTFEDLYLELLSIGAFSGQADITEYSAINDDSDNSTIIELDTILGDGPGLTSPGHMTVLSDDNVNYVLSTGWRRGNSGTYKNISQLLANKVIEGQLTPIKKFLGTFKDWTDMFDSWQVINMPSPASIYWAFNGGAFDLKRGRVNGEWWNFPYAPGTTYTEGTPIDRPNNASGGGGSSSPSGSGGGSSGGGSSTPPRLLILEFENVTAAITPGNDLFGWDYTGTIVLWNGRQLKQSDYTFNEPDIDWNFTIKGTTNIVHLIFPI